MNIDKKSIQNKKLFFHIGYPKTASTFFQRQLFNKHPEINNLGKCNPLESPEYKNNKFRDFFINLEHKNKIQFKFKHNKRLLAKYILPHINTEKTVIFSDEDFTNPWHGDIGLKAKRLKSLFSDFSDLAVIVILRNQIELIRSFYEMWPYTPFAQEKRRHAYDFDKWVETALTDIDRSFLIAPFYFETIEYYQQLFGEDQVKILLFERFVSQREDFCENLSNFLEVDSKATLRLLQKQNKENSAKKYRLRTLKRSKFPLIPGIHKIFPAFIKGSLKSILSKLTNKPKLTQNQERKIKNLYASSNRKLNKIIKVDLDKYDYPL